MLVLVISIGLLALDMSVNSLDLYLVIHTYFSSIFHILPFCYSKLAKKLTFNPLLPHFGKNDPNFQLFRKNQGPGPARSCDL